MPKQILTSTEVHFRLHAFIYEEGIRTQNKIHEVRLGISLFNRHQIGDTVRVGNGSSEEATLVRITNINRSFRSFEEMLRSPDYNWEDFGPENEGQLLSVLRKIYPPEKVAAHGILVFTWEYL